VSRDFELGSAVIVSDHVSKQESTISPARG